MAVTFRRCLTGLRGLVGRKRTDRALALAPEARTEVLLGAGTRAPGQEPDQGDEQVGQGSPEGPLLTGVLTVEFSGWIPADGKSARPARTRRPAAR